MNYRKACLQSPLLLIFMWFYVRELPLFCIILAGVSADFIHQLFSKLTLDEAIHVHTKGALLILSSVTVIMYQKQRMSLHFGFCLLVCFAVYHFLDQNVK